MEILRILTAGFGGYLLASLATITIALGLPLSNKMEAISLATMLSFIIWLCFILYAFSNVKLKNLLIQLTFICTNLFLINTCLMGIKG